MFELIFLTQREAVQPSAAGQLQLGVAALVAGVRLLRFGNHRLAVSIAWGVAKAALGTGEQRHLAFGGKQRDFLAMS